MNLTELTATLDAKRAELAAIFDTKVRTQPDGSKNYDVTADDVAEIERRIEELDRLHDQVQQAHKLARADEMARRTSETSEEVRRFIFDGGDVGRKAPFTPIGTAFVRSDAYAQLKGGGITKTFWSDPAYPTERLFMQAKAVFQTSAGWDPEWTRNDRVELTPERMLTVADLPAIGSTTSDTVAWMEETTKTNAAAETAETSAYAESALALTERTTPVAKIGTFLPVTEEQLRDERRAESYINNRLTRFIFERLDGQLLTGSGVAPNITGILNKAGIQTQAKGTDSTIVAIFKAITKVRFTGYAEPDAVILHPNDWQDVRLMQDANGAFIWGPPSESGISRVWGIPVVVTPAITENTGLVGAWRAYTEWVVRSGIELEVSNSHSDYFIRDQLAIKARIRGAFAIYRPSAFCQVTGI